MERSNCDKWKVETPQKNTQQPLEPHLCPLCLPPGALLSHRGLCPRPLCGDALRAWKVDYKDYSVNGDRMASEIEDRVFQELKSTDRKYWNRVGSRPIGNPKDPRKRGPRRNTLREAVSAGVIANMTAEETASDEPWELRDAMTQEAVREHQMANTGGITPDLLQCHKCQYPTYNQVQTCSADEPAATSALCNECGNHWKFCRQNCRPGFQSTQ